MDVTRGGCLGSEGAGSRRWDLFLGIPARQPTTSIGRKIVQGRVLRCGGQPAGRRLVFALLFARRSLFSRFLSLSLPVFLLRPRRASHSGNSPEASPAKDTRVGNRRTYTRNHFGPFKNTPFRHLAFLAWLAGKGARRSGREHVQVYTRDRVFSVYLHACIIRVHLLESRWIVAWEYIIDFPAPREAVGWKKGTGRTTPVYPGVRFS